MTRVIPVVTIVLLSVSGVWVQDEEGETWQSEVEKQLAKTVSFNFQQKSLNEALDFFRKFAGLNIVLDSRAEAIGAKKFTLKLDNVRVESGIAWTARLMGLEYAVRDEAIFLATRDEMPVDWRGQMQARYAQLVAGTGASWIADVEARLDRKIKVDFRGDHMPAVMRYLATASDLNIVLDYHLAETATPVRLQLYMTVRNILNWVTRQTGVKYVIRDEVIYVASQQDLRALRLETGESPLAVLFRRRIGFEFDKTPVREAIERLSARSGVKIRLDGLGADEKLPVTAKGAAVELNRAVRMVMDRTGRAYAVSYHGDSIDIKVAPTPVKKPDNK